MFPRAHTDGGCEFESVLPEEQEHSFGTAMGTGGHEVNIWRREESKRNFKRCTEEIMSAGIAQ
jgi:hypothetical protein